MLVATGERVPGPECSGEDMTENKRPLSVTIVAWVYIAVGAGGFVFFSRNCMGRVRFSLMGCWWNLCDSWRSFVACLCCGGRTGRGGWRLPGSCFMSA